MRPAITLELLPRTGHSAREAIARGATAVTLEVRSGGVRLTTSALALEPGTLQQKVRVQSQKGRREFLGVLREGSRVEVTL